jgi:hypothetical protein
MRVLSLPRLLKLILAANLCAGGVWYVTLNVSEIPKSYIQWRFKLRTISKNDKEVLMDLVNKFIELAANLNLTYFMNSGTLVGSWRHHGMIPWDDDVDILVDIQQKWELLKAIKKLEPEYFGPDTFPIIKFYSENSKHKIDGKNWRWPFIDISFYRQDKNYIWDTLGGWMQIKLLKEKIFPLHQRPFEQFQLNAPRDSLYYFMKNYPSKLTGCETHWLSHQLEIPVNWHRINCEDLRYLFPFVHRHVVNGTMVEVLILGDKVINVLPTAEDPRLISGPYNLLREKPSKRKILSGMP